MFSRFSQNTKMSSVSVASPAPAADASPVPAADASVVSIGDIHVMGLMLSSAASRGVFKLPHFEQVAACAKMCQHMIANSGATPPPSLSLPDLLATLQLLEFAANNNGFVLDDYTLVAQTNRKISDICQRAEGEKAKAKAEAEAEAEAKAEAEGEEEKKESEEEKKEEDEFERRRRENIRKGCLLPNGDCDSEPN